MVDQFLHLLRWLPYRIKSRFCRVFLNPKETDFSEAVDAVSHSAGPSSYQGTNLHGFRKCMRRIFRRIPRSEIRFIDIGCGKGLALIEAGKLGIAQICGIDYSEELIQICQNNLQAYNRTDIEVFQADASVLQHELDTFNLFYLFNPFGEDIMVPFVKNLLDSVARNPRDINVLYCTPRNQDVFLQHGFEKTDEIIMESPYQRNHHHVFAILHFPKTQDSVSIS